MQVVAHLGQIGKGLNQPLADIPGVGGHKAYSLYAGDVVDALQQLGEIRLLR